MRRPFFCNSPIVRRLQNRSILLMRAMMPAKPSCRLDARRVYGMMQGIGKHSPMTRERDSV